MSPTELVAGWGLERALEVTVLLLILFLALLSPWFMVLSALLYADRVRALRASVRNHPSAQRFVCPVCGAEPILPKKEF